MTQWIVVVPLEAVKPSEPEFNLFIEPGNVLDGVDLPESPLKETDPPIAFTCNGEAYHCDRLDLETCARPKA